MSQKTDRSVKRTKPATSCGECQRRKQKCDRNWPCNHCHVRNVPHLCRFGGPRTVPTEAQGISPESLPSSDQRKRKSIDSNRSNVDIEVEDIGSTLRAFGFGPELDDDKFSTSIVGKSPAGKTPSTDTTIRLAREIEEACSVILPEPYTDSLAQNFLFGGNYFYYVVYPSQFIEPYKQWWEDRKQGKPLDAAFSCLILRICACSAQYLPDDLKRQLRDELGKEGLELAKDFHVAAQRLGANIPPGKGGIIQVQQKMLGAFWLKSRSDWVESWHALGASIHEAQEQGFHLESRLQGLTDFEKEMRRRLWCLLYTWDWQVSLIFSRPMIVNHSNCQFHLPKLKIYTSTAKGSGNKDTPSPFGHMLLQCQLTQQISDRFGVIDLPLAPQRMLDIEAAVRDWLRDLPSIFAADDTDTSTDGEFSWLVYQRAYLHSIAFLLILMILRPVVIQSAALLGEQDRETQRRGIDTAFRAFDAGQVLFDTAYPGHARHHFSPFATFNVATVLCLCVLHDTEHKLPRRGEVLDHIRRILEMLKQLAHETESAVTIHGVLRALVFQLPLRPEERAVFAPAFAAAPASTTTIKRQKQYTPPPEHPGMTPPDVATTAVATATVPGRSPSPGLALYEHSATTVANDFRAASGEASSSGAAGTSGSETNASALPSLPLFPKGRHRYELQQPSPISDGVGDATAADSEWHTALTSLLSEQALPCSPAGDSLPIQPQLQLRQQENDLIQLSLLSDPADLELFAESYSSALRQASQSSIARWQTPPESESSRQLFEFGQSLAIPSSLLSLSSQADDHTLEEEENEGDDGSQFLSF